MLASMLGNVNLNNIALSLAVDVAHPGSINIKSLLEFKSFHVANI
jgi:hypothetical protein